MSRRYRFFTKPRIFILFSPRKGWNACRVCRHSGAILYYGF